MQPRRRPRPGNGGQRSDGAARGRADRHDGRPGARAVLRDAARRSRCRRGARRSRDGGRSAVADRHVDASQPTVDRRRHEASARSRDRVRTHGGRRRVRRRLPARRRRTPRHRTRRVARAQYAPRLRAHDGLGPGRSVRADGGARHQLHRARRCAPLRWHRGDSRPTAESPRRLRRRRDAARGRDPRRDPRVPPVRQGPSRRRRDVRRRRPADDGLLRPVCRRALGGSPARERDRRRGALLPHVRHRRRQALRSRCDGAAVLRGVVRAPWRQRAAGRHARGVGRTRRHDGGAIPREDASRVGGGARHAAVVRVTGPRARGGTEPPAQSSAGHVRHRRWCGATRTGTALLADGAAGTVAALAAGRPYARHPRRVRIG